MRPLAAMEGSDLARRILDASLALIEESGLASLSFREVARRAGVSHQAPYHHFADREAILAAIAREGFDRLGAEMDAALGGAAGLRERVYACATAYVGFALNHPAHFRVMFRPDLVDMERFPEAKCSGDAAFGRLRTLVHELRQTSPERPTPDDDVWTTMLWSSCHGLATLILDGPLGTKVPSSLAREAHVHDVLETLTELVVANVAPRASRTPRREPAAPTARVRPKRPARRER